MLSDINFVVVVVVFVFVFILFVIVVVVVLFVCLFVFSAGVHLFWFWFYMTLSTNKMTIFQHLNLYPPSTSTSLIYSCYVTFWVWLRTETGDDSTPGHASGTTVNMHNTPNSIHKNVIFFLPVWNRILREAIPDSSWQTGTLDYEASDHQVKSEFESQNCQVISVSKLPSFQQFLMAAARCFNAWNLDTSSLRNARRTDFNTSSVS